MDILELENPHGDDCLLTGGQIPNNLALRLDAQKVPILGTSARSIDNAEDRDKFSAMLDRIGVDQPEWRALTSLEDINAFVDKVGFPVLVRPSYVLSGAAMNVCSNREELERFLKLAANVSKKHPVVVSQFIEHAKEVEMDAVAQDGEIIAYASVSISSLPECIPVTPLSNSRHKSCMWRRCAASSASAARLPVS
mgnify:CR=1 FL=1